jgi:hypothetical protein|nr:MAG TPA: hypothetical protein [Caudoviricetes sp.]
MSFEELLIIGLFSVAIYLASCVYIGYRMDLKKVEINLLTLLIVICPLINTICALYFVHKNSDYKKSIEKLFND